MTLRTNGLDWLAQNAGSGNCFTPIGVSYRDADGVSHTGGTKDVVNAFVVANMVGKTSATIIAGTNYLGFKAINDGFDLAIGDVAEAADREADGGTYPQYCYYAATVCTAGTTRCKNASTIERCKADGSGWEDIQTCGTGYYCDGGVCVPGTAPERPETGPLQVTILAGEQCPAGSPSVALDTSEAFAYFKADPVLYVGVMDIIVQSLSSKCFTYYTWEMKMWGGEAGTTCPTTEPEWQQISRFLGEVSDTKEISIKMLGASENVMIGGSFEIPSYLRGTKTLCLSLWGDYDKQQLLSDLAAAGYAEEIAWSAIK